MLDFTNCFFKNVDDGFEWAFVGFYRLDLANNWILLRDEITGLCNLWDVPWYIGGNFNVTLFLSKT